MDLNCTGEYTLFVTLKEQVGSLIFMWHLRLSSVYSALICICKLPTLPLRNMEPDPCISNLLSSLLANLIRLLQHYRAPSPSQAEHQGNRPSLCACRSARISRVYMYGRVPNQPRCKTCPVSYCALFDFPFPPIAGSYRPLIYPSFPFLEHHGLRPESETATSHSPAAWSHICNAPKNPIPKDVLLIQLNRTTSMSFTTTLAALVSRVTHLGSVPSKLIL